MNWQKLQQHFDQAYDFFDRIRVSDSPGQTGVPIYPLIKLSTGLALKAIDNSKSNRLVILLPNRLQIARWIATFATIEVIRKDYYENPTGKFKLSRGQKLLVNNRVVEFDGEDYSPGQKRRRLWVKCSDGRWALPMDRQLDFQPVRTRRRLSTLESVRKAYYSSPAIDVAIDNILDIHTKGNCALFDENLILVSKIGETTNFIQGYYINNSRIVELFQWGKLDVNGNMTSLTSGQYAAEPSCLIASDLYGVAEYVISNPRRTKGIIIDGTTCCLKDIQRLDDDLISRNLPVIVIADFFDTESLPYLGERGFRVWQWNSDNLSQSRSIVRVGTKSPFSLINRSIANYVDQQIALVRCEHPQLAETANCTLSLSHIVAASDNDQLQRLYGCLVRLVNKLSRTVWYPDQAWTLSFCQDVQRLQEDFADLRWWLAQDTAKAIDALLGDLIELGRNPFPDFCHKLNRLNWLIGKLSSSDSVAVVLATEDDAVAARKYWRGLISARRFGLLHFLSTYDFQRVGEALPLTCVIVCGWLNRKKMYTLLHSCLTPKITALLYPFEEVWFQSVQRKWKKQNVYQMKGADFSNLLKLPKDSLSFADTLPQEADSPASGRDFDIVDFELKLERYQYSRYIAKGGTREEVVKARIVIFTQSRFALITESHRLLVVTSLMRGKTRKGQLPRKTVNQIEVGDYILFRESDRDIIREIADEMLAKKDLLHLRETAGIWKKALQAEFRTCDGNIDLLAGVLARAGCKRHKATIRNWLFDDDTIGPRGGRKDLQRLARVTESGLLFENLAQVEEAIRIVRSAHLQASGYITQRLLNDLPKILDSAQYPDTQGRRFVVLNLDDFGQIMILQVEEIGKEWKEYEARWTNRLLTPEDD